MARLTTPFSRAWGQRAAAALLVVGTLSACSTVKAPAPPTQAPQAPVAAVPAAPQTLKVAILLPLSGSSAALGQAMLESAQMALFDLAGDRFELLPRDTKGTPTGAADAARQAIAEGASLILGPLFAADVAAVKPVAQSAGVDVLAFTNDWTQAGNGTYVLGFVPADQVTRVIGFARSRGVTRYVALAPRNAYGDAVVNAVQAASRQFGGQVAQVERYDPAVTDLAQPARQVTQAGVQPQAVMLAEGGPRAQGLASALSANGLNTQQVKLLGTVLWDEPGLGQEPALAGAWFAAPSPQSRADFEARFERTYGRKPPRIATLSYDATAIAAVLAKMPDASGRFDRAALNNPNGFEGMDGVFRLRADGVVERGLAVLEVTPSGPRVIDPAPSSFDVLGQ
ncbi:penicillin-binding protein activator [Azospirillum brasilense]|uniref:Penicillin-binding protein activator n=1 Tax=Azospirillum brasilense TaxID=192 RepID=A0A0P0F0W0_AZOBR|nr:MULTISPECIES: penicillin-binding protein activator [Azospirillum]ALJ36413.1 ABC transporter substrate-binding protein [Azospirillum brasilense]ALJ36621.1 ABC transporter substrate-binding protein [Azospirillum brasilense]MDW7557037.1 penicillin-binding protein activator [Azospirillum brasilense]MDW7591694.1 penicillin-binding protein activator [Azospirillum brasilense]MDW7628029.1 penicillin-binding protein activator [Azospirillum brasilense]